MHSNNIHDSLNKYYQEYEKHLEPKSLEKRAAKMAETREYWAERVYSNPELKKRLEVDLSIDKIINLEESYNSEELRYNKYLSRFELFKQDCNDGLLTIGQVLKAMENFTTDWRKSFDYYRLDPFQLKDISNQANEDFRFIEHNFYELTKKDTTTIRDIRDYAISMSTAGLDAYRAKLNRMRNEFIALVGEPTDSHEQPN